MSTTTNPFFNLATEEWLFRYDFLPRSARTCDVNSLWWTISDFPLFPAEMVMSRDIRCFSGATSLL